MKAQPKILSGWLTTESGTFEVEARYGTKYSVLIVFKEEIFIDETFDLELNVKNKKVPVGACRLIMESERRGKTFHIMPQINFYNFEKLFFRSKIENLEEAAMSLPSLIEYKEKIDPKFKEFVSDLSYELNVYDHLLTKIDDDAKNEPQEVRDFVENKFINSMGADLKAFMAESQDKLGEIVSSFSDKEHKIHSYFFRRQLWNVLLQSPFVARSNLRPRGYAGDSEMMRMIYRNDYEGESTFGKILHKCGVEQVAAESVRERRQTIKNKVQSMEEELNLPSEEKMRILSVACGPAMEIGDILKTKEDCSRLHFSLLDQDEEALSEASSLINIIERSLDTKVSHDLIQESVRVMLLNPDFLSRWGDFHFIYSMGLFDYFTAPVATSVLEKLYGVLKPGGEIAIGNFLTQHSSQMYMEYWLDWYLIYRTEEEFLKMAENLPGAQCKIVLDQYNVQMFLQVKKPLDAQ